MRKYLLATVACLTIASPAVAKDGSGYVGFELGALFPHDPSGKAFVDFTTTNATVPPGGTLPAGIPAGPADFTVNNPFNFNTKTGWDGDIIGGYDFGMFRLEGELGYKHSKVNARIGDAFVTAVNAGLNRPSAAPDPGAPGLAPLTVNDFRFNDSMHVWSAMLNGLLDLGGQTGLGGYIGGGAGYASVHFADQSTGKFAWQAIAGIYYPISENIDIGLKGRYFQTARVSSNDTLNFAGNPNRILVSDQLVDQTTNAVISTNSQERFKSWSLLASFVYNFGTAAPPPPPPPPPAPPPPPPPPATQTCPDGSVILATDTCPAPPPPPPPPPVERGERGN